MSNGPKVLVIGLDHRLIWIRGVRGVLASGTEGGLRLEDIDSSEPAIDSSRLAINQFQRQHLQPSAQLESLKTQADKEIGVTESQELPVFWELNEVLNSWSSGAASQGALRRFDGMTKQMPVPPRASAAIR